MIPFVVSIYLDISILFKHAANRYFTCAITVVSALTHNSRAFEKAAASFRESNSCEKTSRRKRYLGFYAHRKFRRIQGHRKSRKSANRRQRTRLLKRTQRRSRQKKSTIDFATILYRGRNVICHKCVGVFRNAESLPKTQANIYAPRPKRARISDFHFGSFRFSSAPFFTNRQQVRVSLSPAFRFRLRISRLLKLWAKNEKISLYFVYIDLFLENISAIFIRSDFSLTEFMRLLLNDRNNL